MRLKVLLPTRVFLEEDVRRISGEALHGSFTVLPRHVDFVAVLRAGLLYFETEDGEETFIAADHGVLLKVGGGVLVSLRSAVRAESLDDVRAKVEERFQSLNEREKRSRSVLASLESDFIRRFVELRHHG